MSVKPSSMRRAPPVEKELQARATQLTREAADLLEPLDTSVHHLRLAKAGGSRYSWSGGNPPGLGQDQSAPMAGVLRRVGEAYSATYYTQTLLAPRPRSPNPAEAEFQLYWAQLKPRSESLARRG